MEKITRYLPLCLLLAYISKTLATSCSINDSINIIGLVCLTAFFEYKLQNKKFQDLSKRLDEQEKTIKQALDDSKEAKSLISTVKSFNSLRSSSGQR